MRPCAGGLSSSGAWEGSLREHTESVHSTIALSGKLLQLGHQRSHPLGEGVLGLGSGLRLDWGEVWAWQ